MREQARPGARAGTRGAEGTKGSGASRAPRRGTDRQVCQGRRGRVAERTVDDGRVHVPIRIQRPPFAVRARHRARRRRRRVRLARRRHAVDRIATSAAIRADRRVRFGFGFRGRRHGGDGAGGVRGRPHLRRGRRRRRRRRLDVRAVGPARGPQAWAPRADHVPQAGVRSRDRRRGRR